VIQGAVDSRYVIEPFEPAYLTLERAGRLRERAREALAELEECRACPRDCGVNRLAGETKVCRTGRHPLVSSAFAHFGEEACLRGWNGSGTIFFASCNLRCVFCQNWDISQSAGGLECPPERLADLMLALQERGCHNINFVTPEHVAPQVIEAVAVAASRGLRLPIVYNTSAYDSLRSLRLLDGIVDVYMPDFKFWEPDSARRLVGAKDYPERTRQAIVEMHRQVGPLRFGPDGLARRGVLLRHLVMPGQIHESEAIFRWLAEEVSPDTYVNVMAQYRPEHRVGERDGKGRPRFEDIDRRPRNEELARALEAARKIGLGRIDRD
jgi:putative pyruvate formate lyase activating enzyme